MNKKLGMPALAALVVLASGCASPRYIAASTGSKGQVKFLHIDNDGEQGIVKCDVAEDGDLSNCRHVAVVLEDG